MAFEEITVASAAKSLEFCSDEVDRRDRTHRDALGLILARVAHTVHVPTVCRSDGRVHRWNNVNQYARAFSAANRRPFVGTGLKTMREQAIDERVVLAERGDADDAVDVVRWADLDPRFQAVESGDGSTHEDNLIPELSQSRRYGRDSSPR